jgi:hypothetical protein
VGEQFAGGALMAGTAPCQASSASCETFFNHWYTLLLVPGNR